VPQADAPVAEFRASIRLIWALLPWAALKTGKPPKRCFSREAS